MANEDFLSDKDGEPILAPWRKAKLERELEEMEFGEQYVLLARIAGFFPCLNCPNQQDIFLNAREVWKYGVTSKGRQGRYGGKLPHPGLLYKVEFEGLLRDCYKLEKLKIYNYALLPENLRRENRLIRPPGNKQDN